MQFDNSKWDHTKIYPYDLARILHCEKKKSNCYLTGPFRMYIELKSYLKNKKVRNQIIIWNSSTYAQ